MDMNRLPRGLTPIEPLDQACRVLLVKDASGTRYVFKTLEVYHPGVYQLLRRQAIPGIPRIYDVQEAGGILTVLEEWIPGETLACRMEDGRMSAQEAARIMTDLCAALQALHTMVPPIIHRDIKPSNVMLTPSGRAVLLDYNAARVWQGEQSRDTVLLGTKGYAAPEQYGFGASGPRTDIYAMGILLQEMSACMPPQERIFGDIIAGCTHMDPADRFASAAALATAIDQLLHPEHMPPRHHPLALPGFRSGSRRKQILACLGYAWMLFLALFLRVADAAAPAAQVWLNRGIFLMEELGVTFISFNYLGVQRLLPMCLSRRRWIRYLGIFLMDMVYFWTLVFILVLLEERYFGR